MALMGTARELDPGASGNQVQLVRVGAARPELQRTIATRWAVRSGFLRIRTALVMIASIALDKERPHNRVKLTRVIRSSLRFAQSVAHTPRSLHLVR